MRQSLIYSRYFTYIKPVTRLPIVRTYGSTIFTLFAMLIFIFFAIKPTVETILVLQKKLDNTNEVLQKVTQKANDLSLGKQNLDNLESTIKLRIEEAVPSNVGLRSLIETLEKTATVHGASISALQIQPLTLEKKGDGQLGTISEVGFTFNIEGAYEHMNSFLQDLRVSSRLISIDSLSLGKVTEGTGLIMSIIGKAYYIND